MIFVLFVVVKSTPSPRLKTEVWQKLYYLIRWPKSGGVGVSGVSAKSPSQSSLLEYSKGTKCLIDQCSQNHTLKSSQTSLIEGRFENIYILIKTTFLNYLFRNPEKSADSS